MSNRRAQDERIEGTPDGANAITEITDVPDAPTIGTATAGIGNVSVAFTPATTGGTASTFTATSNPGSITGTSATSPITVSGLTGGTSYTFTVRGSNSTGTGAASSASNSVSPSDLVNGYDALASVTLSTATSSVTFSGIPAGYEHLQVRALTRTDRAVTYTSNVIRFNGDTTNTNYAQHELYGNGTSAVPGAGANNAFYSIIPGSSTTASVFAADIIDILDYSNTTKNKTVRIVSGFDANGSGIAFFGSGLWMNTSEITSITLTATSGNIIQDSSFALYGVK